MTRHLRSIFYLACLSAIFLVIGCEAPPPGASSEGHAAPEFGGKIARSYAESEEWWPPEVRPPDGAPNVIIFLLDDTGFAQIGSFGGLIETPNIDRLAANGVRYNNFHTTALCSPSRASLMAGRNPHAIGLGSHALTAMGFPGYNAIVPETAKSVANYLEAEGIRQLRTGEMGPHPALRGLAGRSRSTAGPAMRALPMATISWRRTYTSSYR